jgi:extracellular factor (EF) 3-hydroxypalmitic acid methyl ester biosynthesis protein
VVENDLFKGVNHSGNGNGHNGNGHHPAAAAQSPQSQSLPAGGNLVAFKTAAGIALHGVPVNVTQHSVIFELYNPAAIPQLSESLPALDITLLDARVYSGRALICNVVDAKTKIICEAILEENMWTNMATQLGTSGREGLQNGFRCFVTEWQKSYYVGVNYKAVIAELQTFLADLRLWLDRVEAGIRAAPEARQAALERDAVEALRQPVVSMLTHMFGRFEALAEKVPAEQVAAHRAFGQRLLHPYLLCAPFINRCYTKPMGFAGDYEMMNMIVRNQLEGSTLYAKLTNQFLLDQIGPMAVRGRVDFLQAKIAEETGRVARTGRTAKIFCVACGPAWEAVQFIAEHPLAEKAQFDLLDFNEETLAYTQKKIAEVKRRHQRGTEVNFFRNAVQNLLRRQHRSGPDSEYDLIYCSGLYDYLNDAVCKALNSHLYEQLKPGGLLVVGNFAPHLPVRNFIEHFLEWFLIYRSAAELSRLAPEQAAPENCRVRAETTGTNIFREARKPA